MPELTPLILLILFAGGFMAGFVDSIAGGGGIISLPILLSVGLPPHFALGTNKFQSSFGSLTASINYYRSGLVKLKDLGWGILFTAIGATFGTLSIQQLSQSFLQYLIPILLLIVFIIVLVSKNLGVKDQQEIIRPKLFYFLFGLAMGFYDGFFGPGTGNFWMLAFVFLLGFNLKKATAHTKWVNFTSNIIALIFFAIGGKVLVIPGMVMAGGQLSGAYLGSKLVIRSGTRFIRTFFLLITAATILRLIYTTFFQ
ncbi:MAG TPA: TSUP family transporter [Anaerolineaceae bacterium]|nr:TSUP family transporter [Anaerolineaceae bacterium]